MNSLGEIQDLIERSAAGLRPLRRVKREGSRLESGFQDPVPCFYPATPCVPCGE